MRTRSVLVSIFAIVCVSRAIAAADVTGQWTVTITTADGKITGRASLTQKGDNVTGYIGPSEDATIQLEGVLAAQRLTLKTRPRPGRCPM